jgi:hypothetical protein
MSLLASSCHAMASGDAECSMGLQASFWASVGLHSRRSPRCRLSDTYPLRPLVAWPPLVRVTGASLSAAPRDSILCVAYLARRTRRGL